jgi:hypothetical protein
MTGTFVLSLRNAFIVAGLTFFSSLAAKGGVITQQDLLATSIAAGLTFFIELAHANKITVSNRKGSGKLMLLF